MENRGYNIAGSLSHDVINYCLKRGSSVFSCSLDGKGAFDSILHSVLFQKSLDIIPKQCRKILVYCHGELTVQIKRGQHISGSIRVTKGTRQWRFSHPFRFNIWYHDMIDVLSKTPWGISIDGTTFNIVSFSDDILLSSLIAGGLQNINKRLNIIYWIKSNKI